MIKSSILIFSFGCIFGSFFYLLSKRIIKDQDIIYLRSHCDNCKTELKCRNLVPILSYIKQKGRCSYCSIKLEKGYLIFELLNGFIFLLFFKIKGVYNYLIIDLIMIEILMVIAVIDIEYYIIPNKLSFLLLLISIGKSVYENRLMKSIAIILICLLIITQINKVYKYIGMGDLKLFMILLIFWGGRMFIINLFLTFVLASVISIIKIIFSKISLKERIPFAPYIFAGFLITCFFGNEIFYFYFKNIIR